MSVQARSVSRSFHSRGFQRPARKESNSADDKTYLLAGLRFLEEHSRFGGCLRLQGNIPTRSTGMCERLRPDLIEHCKFSIKVVPGHSKNQTVNVVPVVYDDVAENARPIGHPSPSSEKLSNTRGRPSLADSRYASLLAPRTRKNWRPALPARKLITGSSAL